MAKDPAFLFYYQDFLVGTAFMTNEEVGAYIRVICHIADKGSISKDNIHKICGDEKLTETIVAKLEQTEDGQYFSRRLLEEIIKRRKYCESRRNNRKISQKSNFKGDENHMKNICLTYDEDMKNICSTYENHMKNICLTYEKHMENENVLNTTIRDISNSSNHDNVKIVVHSGGDYKGGEKNIEEGGGKNFDMFWLAKFGNEHLDVWRRYVTLVLANGIKLHRHNATHHVKAFKDCFDNGIAPEVVLEAFSQSNHKGIYYVAKSLLEEKQNENNSGSVKSRASYKPDPSKYPDRLTEISNLFEEKGE